MLKLSIYCLILVFKSLASATFSEITEHITKVTGILCEQNYIRRVLSSGIYIPMKMNRRFGVTWRFHLQDRKRSQAKNQQVSACYLFHAGFCPGLFFDPENGGDMFFRNIG
jgi:hypothetical protein